MTKLQTWMDARGLRDIQIATKLKISRVQVSRIRRGITGASVKTAMKLQSLTNIKWWHFVKGEALQPVRKRAA